MITQVRGLLGTEPVRLILWTASVAAIGALVAAGKIDTSLAGIITAVITAALGFGTAELVRPLVTPSGNLPEAVATGAQAAIDHVRGQVADTLGPTGTDALAQVEAMIRASAPRRHAR
ncbi:hypothetical protein [Nocardia sp. NPDC049149]|uniref:hypothetical protein n=1 Tax=Nocardia sp. NPDC049149 TaxID=3364315 RepID=UPI00371E0968